MIGATRTYSCGANGSRDAAVDLCRSDALLPCPANLTRTWPRLPMPQERPTSSPSDPPLTRLASVLAIDDAAGNLFTDAELADVLMHQLRAPVALDLDVADLADRAWVEPMLRDCDPPIETLIELWRHAAPPPEVLSLVKRFARQCRREGDSHLPDEVATVVYFVSISVARRLGFRITDLAADDVQSGVGWVSEQSWVPGEVKALLD